MNIECKKNAVCYADGKQWFDSDHESLVNEFGDGYEYDLVEQRWYREDWV